MSPAPGATSSARPEDLHDYRAEVGRRHALTLRALRQVEQAQAAYDAGCPDVPLDHLRVGHAHEAVAHLRAMASKVGQVGDAFLAADGGVVAGGGPVRVADGQLARTILEGFPALANAAVLGAVADDLAAQVADGIGGAATSGRLDLTELRAATPDALAADPAFARAVLDRIDPARLAFVVDQLALDAEPGQPGDDLRWLADLFALGAARPDGRPTPATEALLGDADGRIAVRILRSSSTLDLAADTVEALARAMVEHPSRTDGMHPYLTDGRSLDVGDDDILQEAARLPGLALRLLTGDDPDRPDLERLERLTEVGVDSSQIGLAALIDAARIGPGRRDVHGALTPAGLQLLHGMVAALAAHPRAGLATDAPPQVLVRSAAAVVGDDLDQAMAYARASDEREEREARVDELTGAFQHVAEDPSTAWPRLVGQHRVDRRAAMGEVLETDDETALDLAARLDAVLLDAAERADQPDRRLDPVLDRLADVAATVVTKRWGAVPGGAASTGIHAVADAIGDQLAGDPGSAAEVLRRDAVAVDRALAVIDAHPGRVVWAGSGVRDRAALLAALDGPGGERVLAQWELAQGPEVRESLARLRAAQVAGEDPAG